MQYSYKNRLGVEIMKKALVFIITSTLVISCSKFVYASTDTNVLFKAVENSLGNNYNSMLDTKFNKVLEDTSSKKLEKEMEEVSEFPYILGETSRENLMKSALSLVGKVRYVWGGGHITTGTIDGISPAWIAFFNEYGTKEGEDGYGKTLVPGNNWCPIHGKYEDRNVACLYVDELVHSVDEYIAQREGFIDTTELKTDSYKTMISDKVNFSEGQLAHNLDGLDCSGYTSWLFNKVDKSIVYDGLAEDFVPKYLDTVQYGNKLLPGDVYAWYGHIVLNIGEYEPNSNIYIITEASPNMVKFGVMYYRGAEETKIKEARALAKEANTLFGNIGEEEEIHLYDMDKQGYYIEEAESNRITKRYAEIGRLKAKFIDEDTIYTDYNKKIIDMSAKEIIQHTIESYSLYGNKYLTGLDEYNGASFNTKKAKEVIEIQKRKEAENKKSVIKIPNKSLVITEKLEK